MGKGRPSESQCIEMKCLVEQLCGKTATLPPQHSGTSNHQNSRKVAREDEPFSGPTR